MCNLAPCCPACLHCPFYVFLLCFKQTNDDDDDDDDDDDRGHMLLQGHQMTVCGL